MLDTNCYCKDNQSLKATLFKKPFRRHLQKSFDSRNNDNSVGERCAGLLKSILLP